ncbi:MAG: hypothetical protein JXR97_15450, partial [Planctomycetes bacterium]|nr:hypothetical protein [Planctomycetota bacterium]
MKRSVGLALLMAAALFYFTGLVRAGENARSVLIELDGSSSNDPDGDKLAYNWRQISGPKVALSNPKAVKPYFRTAMPGKYRFELTVSDGESASKPAIVEVVIDKENLKPEVRLKPRVEIEIGEKAFIDGSASRDADGDSLTYHWRQIGGAPLYLKPEDLARESISITPAKTGVYEFELVVSDGKMKSVPVRCSLIVKPKNNAPVAKAVAIGKTTIERDIEVKAADINDKSPIARINYPEFS